MAKRCVFRRRLKVPSVSDAVTLDGKVFQARSAATKNARSPIVVRYEDCVTRADVVFGVVLIVIIIVIYVAYTGQIKTDKVNNI